MLGFFSNEVFNVRSDHGIFNYFALFLLHFTCSVLQIIWFVRMSVSLSVCLPACLSIFHVCLSICLSAGICLVCLPTHLPPSVFTSVCLPASPSSLPLAVYPSVYLSVPVYRSVNSQVFVAAVLQLLSFGLQLQLPAGQLHI